MNTLLQIVQNSLQALGVQGYGQPTSVVGNSSQDITQTLALMNSRCRQMAREHQWQALNKEYRFTSVFYSRTGTVTNGSTTITNLSSNSGITSGSLFQVTGTGINQDTYVTSTTATTAILSQAANATNSGVSLSFCQTKYPFPSDFDRQIDRTHWDKSKHWEMLGPETAQEWQWLKSGYISTGPRIRYRPLGNYFQTWPPLATNEYLGFEYLSRYWCLASGDVYPTKNAFTADSDQAMWPDALMEAMTQLAYFTVKNFDTTALRQEFQKQLDLAKAHDAGSPTLSFAPRISNVLIGWENIPDAGYGA